MNKNPFTMNEFFFLLPLGLIAGILSGMVGIGGGIIVVPALVYFLGFSQHSAQGTVLFMFLFPIGILGVLNYYHAGYVEWKTAIIMAIPFIIGSYLGSKISINIDQQMMKKIFGVIIFLVSLKMIFGK
ncbi:MAG: sulfite exporter TauE/SafE family protein [Bacteroidota bacterium]